MTEGQDVTSEKPKLLLVAGPNGSGKTTVTERFLAHRWFDGCEYINPDFIARDTFGDWNSTDAILKAANLAQEKRESCLTKKQNLAFESVFSGEDKVFFIRRAIRAGFFARVFFVATEDPAINALRVARRVMQGGHDVPIQKIISRYFSSIANCVAVAREVDRLYLYDNTIESQDARLVIRVSGGRIVKQYSEAPEWMLPIIANLDTK